MKPKFEIEVKSYSTIHALPNSWSKNDLFKILELADFEAEEDSSEADLYEYLSMTFDELEPEEAATIVLTYVLGNKLNENQIKEIAQEMQEENLWEEYGDMSLHEDLFKITSLLYKAYNGKFPHPDAADVVIQINALNHDAETYLPKMDEVLISRLIAKGMTDHAVINRLFHDFVDAGEWKEAKDIIWQFSSSDLMRKSVQIEFTTGVYWVKELRGAENYNVEFNFH